MAIVTQLATYKDERCNEIVFGGNIDTGIRIKFTGSNNRLIVADGARVGQLRVDFDCDNGTFTLGSSNGVPAFAANARLGQDCTITIGDDVSVTEPVAMSATEGTSITVGNDVMFASQNQVRADDGHPIFDVKTGARVNVSRSITIGSHVWLGRGSTVLGGSRIGDGSVLGYGTLVKGRIPNNCVAVGIPAKVARRDIAWERPHLSLIKPYYKPDASTIVKTARYWQLTEDPGVGGVIRAQALPRRLRRLVRSRLHRTRAGRTR